MQFLNASSEEDFEMLKQTNVPIMNKAVNVIYDLSEDTRIREMARMREKALHDEASALANAENKGIEKGISIGEAKGRAEAEADIINKMKACIITILNKLKTEMNIIFQFRFHKYLNYLFLRINDYYLIFTL